MRIEKQQGYFSRQGKGIPSIYDRVFSDLTGIE